MGWYILDISVSCFLFCVSVSQNLSFVFLLHDWIYFGFFVFLRHFFVIVSLFFEKHCHANVPPGFILEFLCFSGIFSLLYHFFFEKHCHANVPPAYNCSTTYAVTCTDMKGNGCL